MPQDIDLVAASRSGRFPTTVLGNDIRLGERYKNELSKLVKINRIGHKKPEEKILFTDAKTFEECFDNIGYYFRCNFNNDTNFAYRLNSTSGALPRYILQKGCMCQ
jgi:hypothetical protein